jgi:hypothetical protein
MDIGTALAGIEKTSAQIEIIGTRYPEQMKKNKGL